MSNPVAFGTAISEDRAHGSIVAAGRSDTGKILIDLVFYAHPRLLVARMDELNTKHDPVAVIVNPKSQSLTLLKPLSEAGVWVTKPTADEVAVAHGTFLDLLNDGGLEHLNQPPLTNAARASQQRPLAGAKAWEPRLDVDQGPIVAATGAVWGFLEWERTSQPSVMTM